jgi:hypothetical protein
VDDSGALARGTTCFGGSGGDALGPRMVFHNAKAWPQFNELKEKFKNLN